MKNLIIAIIIITMPSCSLIDNESTTDEKFVGPWKLISCKISDMPEMQNMLSTSMKGQGFCEINKVPNTKEAYSLLMVFPAETVVVLNKKDANVLQNEGNLGIYKMSHHGDNKATLEISNFGPNPMSFELEKSK